MASRIVIKQPNDSTLAFAVLSGIFLQTSQAILWRCALQRLNSVLATKFAERATDVATALSAGYCMVLGSFMVISAVQADGTVMGLINSKWYQDWFRMGDGADLMIYEAVCVCADLMLLQMLRENMKARGDRATLDKTLKLRITAFLVIMNLVFKTADVSVKIASIATTYFPFDVYFRSVTVCFETWTLLKLGITVEDVLKGDSWDKGSDRAGEMTINRADTHNRLLLAKSETSLLHSRSAPVLPPINVM
ncbi:hypothetical protein SpCBS45565_g05391 [Spizellomyces sp. 'palustris']|nr:hypothetical protein SpCBS45565_g05391 [Spizellomyces sp. 'palustris']